MATWELLVLLAATVTAMISAGVFFAFSNFIMQALSELPDPTGVAAMQTINRAAPTPSFIACLIAAWLIAGPVIATHTDEFGETWIRLVVAGATLSLVSFLTTMFNNVPKNDALELHNPTATTTPDAWSAYIEGWTRANTARGIASAASVICYVLAFAAT